MPVTDTVSQIEINHFYCQEGKHIFDQAIFRTWNPYTCKYEIRDWRLLKSPEQYPVNNEMIWLDGSAIRKVRGHVYHSWTQFDTEVSEREQLPKEKRRNLSPINLRRVLESKQGYSDAPNGSPDGQNWH